MEEYHYLAKIIFLGESGVGKTCLWHQYCDSQSSPEYQSTIGIEFKVKAIDVDGKRVKLQIWDTASQEKLLALSRSHNHYQGVMGVLLCYAIDKRESFEKIEYCMEEVRKYAEKDICIVLVGTKSDLLNERAVSIDEGKKLAETYGVKFFETSAKENLNVDEAFLRLAKDINVVFDKAQIDS